MRPEKSQAIKLVSENASDYVSVFKEFQAYDGGWLKWPERMRRIKTNLKLDSYVLLYQDQKQIDVCLFMFLMGKEGFNEWLQ